ncbi:hypothetical protein I316_05682 [Kwoniella heveanensis BCC8398]|uniref:CCHC-type domain-containing protein n=1 Tax=Kwoniella heveanensis BCC8398 TaxID=1296120 RepID=A0A1B9GNV9_9TREE|nr:hypothetical protein I316_05682 [Kwoniella heveanensis BCC8398]
MTQSQDLGYGRDPQQTLREPPPLTKSDTSDEDDEDVEREIERLQREKVARRAQRQASRAHPETRPAAESNVRGAPAGPATDETDESYKYYQGRRLASSAFSPGYGYRTPHPETDHLPPPEELVTAEGAVHRIYPAPTPLCPPANADQGWDDIKEADKKRSSSTSSPSIEVVLHKQPSIPAPVRQRSRPLSPALTASSTPPSVKQEVQSHPNVVDSRNREAPPHMSIRSTKLAMPAPAPTQTSSTSKTAYVAWPSEGVQVSDPTRAMDELDRLYQQRQPRFPPAPRKGDGFPQGSRPPVDQGYGRRVGRGAFGGTAIHSNTDQPQVDGWGPGSSRGDNGWEAPDVGSKADREPDAGVWGDVNTSSKDDGWGGNQSAPSWGGKGDDNGSYGGIRGGGDGGYGSTGGNDGCRKCGEQGHFARECPQAGADKCFKCGDIGHMSRECPKAGGDRCYNCGEEGHLSRECTQEKRQLGACHNCGEQGHQARACTQPQKFGAFRGNCNRCGERGHMSFQCSSGSECDGGYGSNDRRSDRGYSKGYGGNDNEGFGREQHDSWGGFAGGQKEGWGVSSHDVSNEVSQALTNECSRPAPAIHPSRLAQVPSSPAPSSARHQPQGRLEHNAVPDDGKRRDNGWGARAQQPSYQPTTIPHREPDFPPASALQTSKVDPIDPCGGW